MPEKLSAFERNRNGGNVFISPPGSELIEHRPNHVSSAMLAISKWSSAESMMLQVFITMLGQNPGPAAAMYGSLIGAAAQRAAFKALARATLKEQDLLDICDALWERHTTLSIHRNKLAHWLWGYATHVPDGVLLCDPQIFMRWELAGKEASEAISRGEAVASPPFPADEIYVYEEHEFRRMSDEMAEFALLARAFSKLIFLHRRADEKAVRAVEQLRQQLLTQPHIQESVSRMLKRRQSAKEAPQ